MGATNSASGDFVGPVIQVGTLHGDLHVNPPSSTPSHYLAQVARIAPTELVGRDAELAELAEFCKSPTTDGQYRWWRAEAWSGKSALLSWFVLNPPPGVRVLSFFITARLAGQSDRHAFVDNLLDQLQALLGTPPRPNLAETTKESHVLGLLADAAERFEHLALVVDGLDEDRGVDGTPDAHSIAALLPACPPANLRVVVAGRLNPPIPADVPAHHPLRRSGVIRHLSPSPEAQAAKDLMERDLKRLLTGSTEDRDLLGLLTAAGGGLTTPDLADLTDSSEWQVNDCLRTVAGRSFVRRPGLHPTSPDVHLLAHEQLHLTAVEMIGRRLADYRQRLHDWADSYRDRGWPPETPEYLLRGYSTLLVSTGDLTRALAFATDPHRHRRLLAFTGGDGTSLTEIAATRDLALVQEPPDLIVLARLAVHRDHIHRQTGRIPSSLPAGWAKLGHLDRAESLVEGMQDTATRVSALVSMASVVATTDRGRAIELLDRAEVLAGSTSQFFGAGPLAQVIMALGELGEHDRARKTVHLVQGEVERAGVLARLALQAAEAGSAVRANRLLDEVQELIPLEPSSSHAEVLATMAAASRMNQSGRATSLLNKAEELLLSHFTPLLTAEVEPVARMLAEVGEVDRALHVAFEIDDDDSTERCVMSIITALAGRDLDGAGSIARAAFDVASRCARLTELAGALANVGDHSHAMSLAREVENAAEDISDAATRSDVLMAVAAAMADAGDLDRAAALAREHIALSKDAECALSIAAAALRVDDVALGTEFLNLTESAARAGTGSIDERLSVLWVRTMADHGDFTRSEALAESLRDRTARSAAWAAIAESATIAGLIDHAVTALRFVEETDFHQRPHLELVRTVLVTGDFTWAAEIAEAARDPAHQMTALLVVAEAARDGDLLDLAGEIADSGRVDPPWAWACLLEVAANLGDRTRAAALLDRIRSAVDPEVEMIPSRLRTLTGAVEATAHLRENHFPASYSGLGPLDVSPYSGPPSVMGLALRLGQEHWHNVVEDLVELRPDAYPAIIAELDRLAEPNEPPSLHPG